MDSYKLKKIIVIVLIVAINTIFIGMASASIMQSITNQLKEDKQEISISQNDKDTEELANIIKYLKSTNLEKNLAIVEILIGLNLVIVAILILLRLKKSN